MMKILMLGNSLTQFNDMPQKLAELLDAEVVAHTRGGARLAEQLNPKTEMGARTDKALREEHFDYVVLQEMSHGPATMPDRYLESVRRLAERIHEAGARPVLYATWTFRPGCDRLRKIRMDADTLHARMQETFRKAAEESGAIVANAGNAFLDRDLADELFASDGYHPSEIGSELAAEVIADAIRKAVK